MLRLSFKNEQHHYSSFCTERIILSALKTSLDFKVSWLVKEGLKKESDFLSIGL